MKSLGLTPILNAPDIEQSFAWFGKFGCSEGFVRGELPGFGSACSGKCEIFPCRDAQGGRGKGNNKTTFDDAPEGETADHGVSMSPWVHDVDAVHRDCLEQGIEITWPPADMPWGVRGMRVRHPYGHIFRVSRGNEETKQQ